MVNDYSIDNTRTNVRPAFVNTIALVYNSGYLSNHVQTFTSYYLGSLNLLYESFKDGLLDGWILLA